MNPSPGDHVLTEDGTGYTTKFHIDAGGVTAGTTFDTFAYSSGTDVWMPVKGATMIQFTSATRFKAYTGNPPTLHEGSYT